MNNLDLDEVLNKEISDLVDLLHTGFKEIAEVYELNTDQISEMEKDFIARLAFAAIKYGVNKEEDEKESEKSEKPEQILKNICNTHGSCMGCMFARSDTSCRLAGKPYHWEV